MSDKLPPNNPSAEAGLLGCFMLKPESLLEIVSENPAIGEFFFDQRNAEIFNAMRRDFKTDPLEIWNDLRNAGFAIGMDYLAGLTNQCGSGQVDEARRFAEMLKSDYARRRIIEASARIERYAREETDAATALAESEKEIASIGDDITAEQEPDISAMMDACLEEMEESIANKGSMRGLRVGFRDFDFMTLGLRPGQLIVIAARPGVGKTSFAMNMAEFVAVEKRSPVGVFSLEMDGGDLAFRMACSRARICSRSARNGDLEPEELARFTTAGSNIAKSPIHICDRGGLTITQISARARRMVLRHKVKLIVIDYLQLLGTRNRGNRNDQISEMTNGIKALARDLRIPIILLSQLNREIEKDNRDPRMSDLRDSGSIEQDADIIIFLNPKDSIDAENKYVEATVAKHRGGQCGKIYLAFNGPQTRFYAPSKTEDVPSI